MLAVLLLASSLGRVLAPGSAGVIASAQVAAADAGEAACRPCRAPSGQLHGPLSVAPGLVAGGSASALPQIQAVHGSFPVVRWSGQA